MLYREAPDPEAFVTPPTPPFLPPVRTFFQCPPVFELGAHRLDVALMGVPYDAGAMTAFIRSGTSRGPDAVRDQAVFAYRGGRYDGPGEPGEACAGWFDVEERRVYLEGAHLGDVGDVPITGGDTHLNLDRITAAAETLAATDAVVAAVGGDHSISFPVGRGMSRYEQIDIVHFDAHPDFTDVIGGSRYTHGSNLRRLSELPFVRNISMVGIRNCAKEVYDEARERGIEIVTSKDLVTGDPAEVIRRTVPPSENLYVSIDSDVLDGALVPGTTLPEPFGIDYRTLRTALAEVAGKGRVRGFDLVEMTDLDGGVGSARVAAWVLAHFISTIVEAER